MNTFDFYCDRCDKGFKVKSKKKCILDTKGIKCPECKGEWGKDNYVRQIWSVHISYDSKGSNGYKKPYRDFKRE